jgi:hypothetical protein
MSHDVVSHIIKHKSKIKYDIIDDVAIGIYIKEYMPSAYYFKCSLYYVIPKLIKPTNIDNKFVFFRNRAYKNRAEDVKHMRMIRNVLYKNRHTKKLRLI